MNWAFWRREGQAKTAQAARPPEPDDGARADPAAELRIRARRRLIGAAVLLLAAAVLVPMVLDPAPRPVPDNLPIEIPSEKTPFAPRLVLPPVPEPAAVPMPPPDVAPVPGEGKSEAGTEPNGTVPTGTDRSDGRPQPRAEGNKAEARGEGKSGAIAESRAEPAAVASSGAKSPSKAAESQRARDALEGKAAPDKKAARFALQAAAMGSEKSAQELADRLRKAGFAPYTEQVQTAEGARWRVRVGPFASREEAETARARLRALEVNATLVPGG